MPTYEKLLKRQKVLAQFGDFALHSEDLDEILTHACHLVSQALETDLAKILEINHDKQELLVKAGVGWPPGIVGKKRLPLAKRSSETYSVAKGVPVVTPNMLLEQRFEFADFLKEAGVVAIVNVPIFLPGKEKVAYGLLQVDIGERVETLRLVHEQLYVAGKADQLELRPYVSLLVESLCRMHDGHSGKVRLVFDIADVELTPEQAVPLGLILNEFVTNSLKYAFTEQGGVIAVSIAPCADGRVRVHLSDDGRGLPTFAHTSRPGSGTGMKIIEGLARQLGAKPVWTSTRGTALSLEFVSGLQDARLDQPSRRGTPEHFRLLSIR